jgi:membrane protein required for colicin V production
VGEFTLLDWIVVLILVSSVVASLVRGFVREVLGLATVVIGFLVAAWFHPRVAGLLQDVFQTENQSLFAGFVILFVGTLAAGFLLIRLIQRFFEFAHIEWVDRLLGGAFGLVRGWLLAAVIFLALTSFGVLPEAVREARLAPYFLPAVRSVVALTPFDLKARFLIGYGEVERWWREGLDRIQLDRIQEEAGSDPAGEPGDESAGGEGPTPEEDPE